MPAPVEEALPFPPLRNWGLALVTLAAVLVGYCLWAPAYLPLLDLPNHLARHWLESRALAGQPLPPFYSIHYRVLPNLGADLCLPPLLLALEPQTAARLFLTLSALLFWAGPAVFLARVAPDRTRALVGSLFLLPGVFDPHLFLGFLNYYSGFGLTFLALAHFLSMLRRDRPAAWQLALHSVLVALLFLWHLSLWGIYGVVMGCYLLADLWPRGRGQPLAPVLARALLLTVPVLPSLALVAFSLCGQSAINPESGFDWGTVSRKLILPFQLFQGYNRWTDLSALLLWLAGLAVGFRLAAWRQCPRQGALLSLVVLGTIYLLLPYRLGSTAHTDTRLLPALLVLSVAVVSSLPLRRARLALLLLSLSLLARGSAVAWNWTLLGQRLGDQARVLDALEPGCRVLPIVLLPAASFAHPESHFVCWAVPTRSCFVPTLFARPDQHVLRINPPWDQCFAGYADAYPASTFTLDEGALRGCYDHLWVCNPAGKEVRLPRCCQPIVSTQDVTLYRVVAP